ncbi:3-hydroxyisobutyrate dehydrogenase-like beta-hydroxyacid dehydrogenase [Kibdelosporangium banguiense]|uniref:3-hydroxyisobutyrate dehydrogenase-like beta-hydroxyacid dehydrogenase n=1 Tax=Kibdelosporangium banguiense TaxID=1365924 RepID=A0ABS4TTB9_9PSEU|nr:NAD(P)-dependent oxidoreductase [Kibdelosporangium banguiense]MBP2327628.1 3-hydroxyisobutyrate dehydrogenase-like beta-hydroxyacid dehydrogenase [Kibdelosporangium banguiense]
MITNPPVTVLGLGLMGQALAGTFLRAGHPTTVWNRTASKAEHLVAQGATLAGSPAEAVAASPLVVVCVSDYAAVHELLDPLVLDGKVVVNLTSGTTQTARETAAWAAQRGVTYLDGAIMAIPQAIGTADAVVLYSGPRSAFDSYEPVLKSLAAATTYLGDDHGLSSLYDVALLGLMWSVLNGFLQGAALVGAAGVDASVFEPFARNLIGTVGDWLPPYAKQIDDGTYPAYDSTIDTHLGAMDHLIDESESLGVNPDLPRLIKAVADRAVAAGHGGHGYAAMIEQFRKSPGE